MSNEYSAYIDDPSIPTEMFTTYYLYTKQRGNLPEEVNGVGRVEFTAHHVLFFDGRGILICAVPAADVTNLEQSVAA